MRQKSVALIGQCVWDQLSVNDRVMGVYVGGTAAYSAEVFKALGWSVSRIKDQERSVDHSALFHNSYSRGRRVQYIDRISEPVPYQPGVLFGFDLVLFGPLWDGDISPDLYRLAQVSSTPRAVDIQGLLRRPKTGRVDLGRNTKLWDMISGASFVKASAEECKVATCTRTIAEGARAMQSLGHKEVVVTEGRNGAWVFAGDKKVFVSADLSAAEVDSTGCGDVFFSTYCAGRVGGMEPRAAAEVASAMAAVASSHIGVVPSDLFRARLNAPAMLDTREARPF